MKKLTIISLCATLALAGCQQSTRQTQEEPSTADKEIIARRVERMYHTVFTKNNLADAPTYVGKEFFSKQLRELWESLPKDYAVVKADPWTWAPRADSSVFMAAEVKQWGSDTIVVRAFSQSFAHQDSIVNLGVNQRILTLVYEKQGEGGNWYVDDFASTLHERPTATVKGLILKHNQDPSAWQKRQERDKAALRLTEVMRAKQMDKALLLLDTLKGRYPDDPHFLFCEGWIHDIQGDTLHARTCFEHASAIYYSRISTHGDFSDRIDHALITYRLHGRDAYRKELRAIPSFDSPEDSLAVEELYHHFTLDEQTWRGLLGS